MQSSHDEFLWQKAASFAARAHRHHIRKDGHTPYVAHPFRVALTVRHVFGESDIVALCAALLHDVIEDTTSDYDDLAEEFGEAIAATVACVSKDPRLPELDREKAFYQQIALGPWQARLVKLADAYDNICDANTPKASVKALSKGRLAIEAAGDDPLLTAAVAKLRELIEERQERD